MQEKEEGISEGEDEFGVLRSGRRYKKLRTMAEERERNTVSTQNITQYPYHRSTIDRGRRRRYPVQSSYRRTSKSFPSRVLGRNNNLMCIT
jgi:hypothetical protein